MVDKKAEKIIDINISRQEMEIVRDAENGTKEIKIGGDRLEKQKLSRKQILELADICMRIEKHYGFPCDIEWAMEKNEIFITQSRPITTLSRSANKETLTLIKEHTREYSLFQVVSYCDALDIIEVEIGYKPRNELFLYEKGLVIVCHEPNEVRRLFENMGKKVQDASFLNRILEEFEESFLQILPFLEAEKTTA